MPAAERIVTVRLIAQGHGTFAGEDLIPALREVGLRHGRFGIFHRHDPHDEMRILFSVASLTEPGSFDLTRAMAEQFPGVSLFALFPGPGDPVAAFDDMLSTARDLARRLDGEILDEQGSRLSVQRERYLREEVIQFRHKPPAS
jgi:cell division protein ZipA